MLHYFTIWFVLISYICAQNVFYDLQSSYTTPGAATEDCRGVVGRTIPNDLCEDLCNISRNQYRFFQRCFDDAFYIAKCYGAFNFWFNTTETNKPLIQIPLYYKMRRKVDTPRACQTECQHVRNCYWFVYNGMGSSTVDSYSENGQYNCYLMTLSDLVNTNLLLYEKFIQMPKLKPEDEVLEDYFCLSNAKYPSRNRLVCNDYQLCADWTVFESSTKLTYDQLISNQPEKFQSYINVVVSGPQFCDLNWTDNWEDKFCPPLVILYEKLHPDAYFKSNFPRNQVLEPGEERVTKYLVRQTKDKLYIVNDTYAQSFIPQSSNNLDRNKPNYVDLYFAYNVMSSNVKNPASAAVSMIRLNKKTQQVTNPKNENNSDNREITDNTNNDNNTTNITYNKTNSNLPAEKLDATESNKNEAQESETTESITEPIENNSKTENTNNINKNISKATVIGICSITPLLALLGGIYYAMKVRKTKMQTDELKKALPQANFE